MIINMSISGRLAILTFGFVFLMSSITLFPALAIFRESELQERIEEAALVALALTTNPIPEIDIDQSSALLEKAQILDLAVIDEGQRKRLLLPYEKVTLTGRVDLTNLSFINRFVDGFKCALNSEQGIYLISGIPSFEFERVEAMVSIRTICSQVRMGASRFLFMSFGLALATSFLITFAVSRLVVRPVHFLTKTISNFDGKGISKKVEIRNPIREFQNAEKSLKEMQDRVINSFEQQRRLATLGESVSKIQHDLRNMLSTAQLLADNLEESEDPKVRRSAPRLLRAIDRAINLSSQTLTYGNLHAHTPKFSLGKLAPVINEVMEDEALLDSSGNITFSVDCDQALEVHTDFQILKRILQNLIRNARQALEELGEGKILISVKENEGINICVRDTGPGLKEETVQHLFEPFRGSTRSNGSGLGLAIGKELSELIGGSLKLSSTSSIGTEFLIELPNKHI